MNRKEFVQIAISALRKWQDNNATLRAAALTFFIVLPLPSLLLITVDIYSQLYGRTQGIQQLIQQISSLAGPTLGSLVNTLIQGATDPLNSVFNSIFTIIFAIAGAIGAFAVLQDTFNVLWNIKLLPKHQSIQRRIRLRSVPFLLVTVSAITAIGWVGFTGLVFNTIQNAVGKSMGVFAASVLLFIIQAAFTFGLAIVLFAIIFKEIPDTPVEWGDVWLGAVITAIVFTIANYVFKLYLQTFPVTSLAGAAGSLIILLLWVFVIAQILLYGAQFSHCVAENVGSHAEKGENHPHPWKKLENEALNVPERIDKEIEDYRFGKEEQAPQLNTKPETPNSEPQETPRQEPKTSPPEPQKQPIPNPEELKTQEPNPQIPLSQEQPTEKIEKEYDLNLKWKTKKKRPTKKDDAQ